MLLREVKLALFLEARAGVALTQDLEGRPILGELLRDTALGRDDGLREMLGLLVLRAESGVPLGADDDVFYLFLQKQKIGAKLHIYL